MITKIKVFNISEYNCEEQLNNLIEQSNLLKENLDNTNISNINSEKQKYDWFKVEIFLSEELWYKKNDNLTGWWDLSSEDYYFDNKTVRTQKVIEDITKTKQSIDFDINSNWYAIFLQAKQVNHIKSKCEENSIPFNKYYFLISYYDCENWELKTVFSQKLRLDNVLTSIRRFKNPPYTKGNKAPVDNYIITDIYESIEIETL